MQRRGPEFDLGVARAVARTVFVPQLSVPEADALSEPLHLRLYVQPLRHEEVDEQQSGLRCGSQVRGPDVVCHHLL